MTRDQSEVKSTVTCFEIIEQIQSGGSAGVSELAREVGLSKSAVYKHVRTLTRLGYLVRRGNEYDLSLRLLTLGIQARERLPLDAAENVVAELAETTGHVTNFVVRENGHAVYAFRVEPEGSVDTDRTAGESVPFHAIAGGKAILAYLDEETRDEIVESVGLPKYTDKTITDRATLEDELQSIRDKRVAFDREEYDTGNQCVASPVLDSDGVPVGAVSVTGAIQHMSGKRLEEDVVGLVISAAKNIEKEARTA